MDNLLWIAMSGAKENFHSLSVRSNNLANANTVGFKSDFENSRAMSVFANAYPTRAFAMTERPGYNMQDGALESTGRALDVAIAGEGFLAVADSNGNEAYTRFGSLELGPDGVLRTSTGLDVLDEDGAQIILPMPLEDVAINEDGVISARPQGADRNAIEEFQRLKFVKPDIRTVEKGYDGLFRSRTELSITLHDDGTYSVLSTLKVKATSDMQIECFIENKRLQENISANCKFLHDTSSCFLDSG